MKKKIVIAVIILLLVAARSNDHIYGLWVFYNIGRDITVNIKDDTQKARAAAYWVFDNIQGIERYSLFKNMDDNFMNVYRRKMGSCDQSSWAYVVMTSLLGLDSRLLFLIDERGISSHTVASVKIKGNIYIVDTLVHYMFDLSDEKAFKEYQNLFRQYCIRYFGNTTSGCSEPDISWFKNGQYQDTFKEKLVKKLLRRK